MGLDLFGFMVFNATFNNILKQYFSCIVAASFIGGGNHRTQKTPLTCRK
jgi:hypothetical protein